ncbi:MAG: hypothetical protein Q3M24_19620 [Candidatus Electrothrix aestuarii]|uniref:DUF4314 domain-containing protein n=1 Tax=Candidatus Electrothrix aestuarii TaxID=3062594 RepID=A0AAU8M216_9BACT|nr:hypothetical protein [Candidatus Electrothrix aestuarii]
MAQNKLQVGDSVVVKPNAEDPDLDIIIGGWQGRITEIEEEDNVIGIEWDSQTLRQMPDETIIQSEEEGLDWTKMYLLLEDVERTTPRDSENDVQEVIDLLTSKHEGRTWVKKAGGYRLSWTRLKTKVNGLPTRPGKSIFRRC